MNKKEAKPSQILKEQCGNAKKRLRRVRRVNLEESQRSGNIYSGTHPDFCPGLLSLPEFTKQCRISLSVNRLSSRLQRSGLDGCCFLENNFRGRKQKKIFGPKKHQQSAKVSGCLELRMSS